MYIDVFYYMIFQCVEIKFFMCMMIYIYMMIYTLLIFMLIFNVYDLR